MEKVENQIFYPVMLSIDQHLHAFAMDTFCIKASSPEATKIQASIKHLKKNLSTYFQNAIIDVIVFGSYERDTVLPKAIDPFRDVDLMILFDHTSIKVNPITYRNHIQGFSDFFYPKSASYKAKPTVVLELNHLRYDLVPAYKDVFFFGGEQFYIPKTDVDWMQADPYGFHKKLNEKDSNNKQFIKPVIRLLKAWNAKAGYPVPSFKLEKDIVATTYYFLDTLEEYFFDTIESLNSSYHSETTNDKINALKENARKVKKALKNDESELAMKWLAHILPSHTNTLYLKTNASS